MTAMKSPRAGEASSSRLSKISAPRISRLVLEPVSEVTPAARSATRAVDGASRGSVR
jgi:hypothetical protein